MEDSRNAEKQTSSASITSHNVPSKILTKDLEYGDVAELSLLLEEVSKLLEAYSQANLNSDF